MESLNQQIGNESSSDSSDDENGSDSSSKSNESFSRDEQHAIEMEMGIVEGIAKKTKSKDRIRGDLATLQSDLTRPDDEKCPKSVRHWYSTFLKGG